MIGSLWERIKNFFNHAIESIKSLFPHHQYDPIHKARPHSLFTPNSFPPDLENNYINSDPFIIDNNQTRHASFRAKELISQFHKSQSLPRQWSFFPPRPENDSDEEDFLEDAWIQEQKDANLITKEELNEVQQLQQQPTSLLQMSDYETKKSTVLTLLMDMEDQETDGNQSLLDSIGVEWKKPVFNPDIMNEIDQALNLYEE